MTNTKPKPHIGGQRPRPRVGLIGEFSTEELDRYQVLFPTVWIGEDQTKLQELVNVRELDLLIVQPGVGTYLVNTLLPEVPVICFSQDVDFVPGPLTASKVVIGGLAKLDEFILPELPQAMHNRRSLDLGNLTSVRNLRVLNISNQKGLSSTYLSRALTLLRAGAIIQVKQSGHALGSIFKRENGFGLAWLPLPGLDRKAWVELIVSEWAKQDRMRFPDFGDWSKSPEWMVREEEDLLTELANTRKDRMEVLSAFEKQEADLSLKLVEANNRANKGLRRLLTAQGDELVAAVADFFRIVGFQVEILDQKIKDGDPKREDLRLKDGSWEAIAEVRGYSRSGGKGDDLHRLYGFSDRYLREKGKMPSKRIYVVNGQIELPPSQRQEPFAPAPETVEAFGENDGLVIWSVDLFRVARTISEENKKAFRQSIIFQTGRWRPA